MLEVNRDTLQLSSPQGTHPSLLPLRMALIAAESESPSRPPQIDVNEQRAMQLIQKMKSEYKKPLSLLNWNDIPSQHGLHIRLQELTAASV